MSVPRLPSLPTYFSADSSWRWIFPLLIFAGQAILLSLDSRGQTAGVMLGFGLGTLGWIGACVSDWSRRQLIGLIVFGFVLRALWLAFPPLLSDDWCRYVWDGLISYRGGNSFDALPSELPAFEPTLLAGMNSPDYYTVYPPVAQAIFRLAAEMGGGAVPSTLLALRALLLLAEGACLSLLWKLTKGKRAVLLYALAPLALVEPVGSTHLEGVAILGVFGAAWSWSRFRQADSQGLSLVWFLAGVFALSLGVGAKLTPLVLLPLLPFLLGWVRGILAGTLVIVLNAVAFVPFWSPDLLAHFGSSLDLYFRTFEFNGGLYAALRWLSIQWTGYNQIALVGPWLGAAAACAMVGVALWKRPKNTFAFLAAAWWIMLIHQASATTVHPWYLLPLVGLAPFVSWRFGLAWAALVPLTYAAYTGDSFHHPHALMGLEYGLVLLVLVWECGHRWKAGRAEA